MPTSASKVRATNRTYGINAKKHSARMAATTAPIKQGDLIGIDGAGKAVRLFVTGTDNVDSVSTTRIAGFHTGEEIPANSAERDWDFWKTDDDLLFPLPIVANADNTPTTFAQSMVSKAMRLRCVQSDDANTNLRGLFVACHDENTTNTSPIVCVGVDPATQNDAIAYGLFRVLPGFQRL